MSQELKLSRRERQIMDILHARGEAAAREVRQHLPEAPSYSAVRALLRILEEKGFVKHRQEGARYVFMPKGSTDRARKSALRRVVETFFGGSAGAAAAALLEEADLKLSNAELEKVESVIQKAKREGR